MEGLGIKFIGVPQTPGVMATPLAWKAREAVLHFPPNLILINALGSTTGHLGAAGGSKSGTATASPSRQVGHRS